MGETRLFMKRPITAILLDLDGVLYVGDAAIAGAQTAMRRLKASGFELVGVTNTTTQSRASIATKLQGLGFDLSAGRIYTPAAVAVQRIDGGTTALFIRKQLMEDFVGVRVDEENPDYVVMGDIGGEGYPPEVLRTIFHHVMRGARILALHKNRFWQKPDGLHLDLGVFVAAIEYATNQKAEILGKPAGQFYRMICKQLAVSVEQAVMIGDDVESDIDGARQAGLATILVQTGKYREVFVRRSGIKPDLVIPSIADLPDALQLL